MTWRCAAANIPFGGAAGALVCDSTQFSRKEFESLVRKYTGRIRHLLGPYQDLCAPGANAGEEIMTWMQDECRGSQKEGAVPVLGKPDSAGGLRNRDAMIGKALAALALRSAQDIDLGTAGVRVAIRSLDQAAFSVAESLFAAGCVIVAISEARGGLRCSTGIDMRELGDHLRTAKTLAGYEGAAGTTDVHDLDCDVLILAAPEGTLDSATAASVRAKLVLEASELVITPAGDRNLASRGISVIPDLVGAAGSVVSAYAEWSNNVQHAESEPDRVEREMQTAMMRAYAQVLDRSRRENVSMRMAAYCLAVERVARCERLRVA
jgi:glutamate dehydrogenase/leucine dehydrogenase